ncbi:hypothetical protein [Aestuariirhabdus litorea]|uniref:Methyl-accepting chemotaxis protein n=1 Tax=Aestuariirhabdus litorea TaxID=2528527 RepID=A0A3P3VNC3_9GAMM|nr:hypothetical protein [Aestuariirhabdus litorea]RRJ83847.1 hypothetical protein D0544_01640 [Aestuariirhabdus litorea]RWW97070.1 hypothetical protein DZC74_01640 [Endozoicomonadaceae bacterium GTF-13]
MNWIKRSLLAKACAGIVSGMLLLVLTSLWGGQQLADAISDMNTQIATAAEEQSSVSEEITRNITEITSIASKNSKNAQHTAETSEHLVQLSNALKEVARRLSH